MTGPPSEEGAAEPTTPSSPTSSRSTPNHEDRSEDNPLSGLAAFPCPCPWCRWHRTADRAIALNGAVRLEGSHSVMVVADTVVAEVAANGGQIPDTWRLMRDDGRSVYVFVDEEPAA
jgi:hypothetical protein